MKKIIVLAAVSLVSLSALSDIIIYRITMNMKVPRVYDNAKSLGYRKVQQQVIKGYISVDYGCGEYKEPVIYAYSFLNRNHKIGGKNVTYAETEADDVMWRYIGSNKRNVFTSPNIKFSLDLDPSYNIGADEPDNTLVITLSGSGISERTIKGAVTGQIGCGCMAYGHISPTRGIDFRVSDITPLYGTFNMRKIETIINCR